jgi:nonsense-mediated mRNA decay protein 3
VAKIPCPYCGRLVDRLIEGMCEDCYLERHPLVALREKRALKCKYCGALFIRGKWVRGKTPAELFTKFLSDKGEIRGVIEKVEVEENEEGMIGRITVRGSPHELMEPRVVTYEVAVEYIYDICISCREMLSKKEAAVAQIRSTPWPLDDLIKKKILNIIEQEIFKLKEKKIGFISNIKQLKNGFDIYTTSANLARHLAYVIHSQLPSHVIETAKVVGVKDGRKIYFMTYSVRILTCKPGDVIKTREGEMRIININNKYVNLQDINTKKYMKLTISELLSSNIIFIRQQHFT